MFYETGIGGIFCLTFAKKHDEMGLADSRQVQRNARCARVGEASMGWPLGDSTWECVMLSEQKPLQAAEECEECKQAKKIDLIKEHQTDRTMRWIVSLIGLSGAALIGAGIRASDQEIMVTGLAMLAVGALGLLTWVSTVELFHFTVERDRCHEYHIHRTNPVNPENLLHKGEWYDAGVVLGINYRTNALRHVRLPSPVSGKMTGKLHGISHLHLVDRNGNHITLKPHQYLLMLNRAQCFVEHVVEQWEEHGANEVAEQRVLTLGANLRALERLTSSDRALGIVGRTAAARHVHEFAKEALVECGLDAEEFVDVEGKRRAATSVAIFRESKIA